MDEDIVYSNLTYIIIVLMKETIDIPAENISQVRNKSMWDPIAVSMVCWGGAIMCRSQFRLYNVILTVIQDRE